MTRTSTAATTQTRERILMAASEEFAAHGFAGARMDRIAAAANTNKERLYAYFDGKRSMFVEAMAQAIREIGAAVSVEVRDLPDLAGRMFDFVAEHPDNLRLLTWARLAGDDLWREARPLLDSGGDLTATIEDWQAAGSVDTAWSADDLFVAILGLCEIWHLTPFAARTDEPAIEKRRRGLVIHVARTLSGVPDRNGADTPPPAASLDRLVTDRAPNRPEQADSLIIASAGNVDSKDCLVANRCQVPDRITHCCESMLL